VARKKQKATIKVECNGTFPMSLNGFLQHPTARIRAEVDAEITHISYRKEQYEPEDSPSVRVTGATVEMEFDNDQPVEGSLTFTGKYGFDLFHHYWWDSDIYDEAVSLVEDDEADSKYEAQREMQEESELN